MHLKSINIHDLSGEQFCSRVHGSHRPYIFKRPLRSVGSVMSIFLSAEEKQKSDPLIDTIYDQESRTFRRLLQLGGLDDGVAEFSREPTVETVTQLLSTEKLLDQLAVLRWEVERQQWQLEGAHGRSDEIENQLEFLKPRMNNMELLWTVFEDWDDHMYEAVQDGRYVGQHGIRVHWRHKDTVHVLQRQYLSGRVQQVYATSTLAYNLLDN